MPVAATLGLGSIPCDCLTALVLNLHGNAITLSNELWKNGVRDGATLRAESMRLRREKVFTFGVVYPFSSHNFLLRDWLLAAGIHPDRDVRIVVMPPPQMVANLKAGNLDGFCAGEPWNSVAVQSQIGWCAATSAELAPGHPEKVLMVRRDFAEKRDEEHLALVAALLEACKFCDAPDNREQIIAALARPAYVNVPAPVLRRGFSAEFDFGCGEVRKVPNFNIFHRHSANAPSDDKAAWILQRLRTSGLCPDFSALNAGLGQRVFRKDIFDRAVSHKTPVSYINRKESPQAVLV
jgi:ABC-type nitrate/sulfonate/bicarbonate transport system substrate-binding protein